jgi:hypothetical protein
MRGEAPYASHLLYTQDDVLDDTVPEEREHGIQAGFAFRHVAKATVVYVDLGLSRSMEYGIKHARLIDSPLWFRSFPDHQHFSIYGNRQVTPAIALTATQAIDLWKLSDEKVKELGL